MVLFFAREAAAACGKRVNRQKIGCGAISLKNRKRQRAAVAAIVAVLLAAAAAAYFAGINPPKDNREYGALPAAYFCETSGNHIAQQTDGKCAAYASAYVLRHFGEPADGETVYPEIKRTLGFVSAKSIVAFFEARGYSAQAYHGDIDTLKQSLAAGVPVIAFVSIPGDTHYLVVVGYDAQYLYLADSLAQTTDSCDTPYNRKLTTAEFEAIWRTDTPLSDNIYVVVSK